MSRARSAVAAPLLAAAVGWPAGCAAPESPPPTDGGAGRPTPDARVEIEFDGGDGDRRRALIVCGTRRDEVGGYLRGTPPAETCRRVAELRNLLTSPPRRDRACAQVYGGPERARFSGTLGGRRVERRFSRTDSCQVADWTRVEALLPPARY